MYPARRTEHWGAPRRGSHYAAWEHRTVGLAGLLLGLPGGLYSCAAVPLGSVRVAGSASGVQSHDVGRRAERTTLHIEHSGSLAGVPRGSHSK